MLIEFDPQCGTAQPEDYLQLYIPERSSPGKDVEMTTELGSESPVEVKTMPETLSRWCPVLRKFHGGDNWPSMSLVLPGENEGLMLKSRFNSYLVIPSSSISFYDKKNVILLNFVFE